MSVEYIVILLFIFSMLGFIIPRRLTRMSNRVLDLGNIYAVIFITFHGVVLVNGFISHDGFVKVNYSYDLETYSSSVFFLVLWIIFFWIGYLSIKKRPSWKKRSLVKRKDHNSLATWHNLPLKKIALIFIIFEFILLSIYIYSTGGLEAFIFSHRETVYANQWQSSSDQMYENYIRIFTGLVFTVGAILGGILQGLYNHRYKRQVLLFYVMMLPGIIIKLALLSRGIFLFPLIFWLTKKLVLNKFNKRELLKGLILLLILFSGIIIILDNRENNDLNSPISLLIDTGINGFSGYFLSKNIPNDLSLYEGFINVINQLSPLPSLIIDKSYDNNLTYLLYGVKEGSSMPMPFIGEAYYNLGNLSLILAFLIGAWCATVSKYINMNTGNIKKKIIWYFLYMASVLSFIYMPHSGLRSTTRLIVWIMFFSFTLNLLKSLSNKKKL